MPAARDLTGDLQLELTTRVAGLDPAALAQILFGNASPERSLPLLFGEFALTARPAASEITVSSLQLASAPENPLQLALQATAALAGEAYQGKLEADYAGTDTALLENLTGLRLAPMDGRLTLEVDNLRAELVLKSRIGDTELALSAHADHADGAITGLSASLDSPMLRLADLGLQAVDGTDEAYRPAERPGRGTQLSAAGAGGGSTLSAGPACQCRWVAWRAVPFRCHQDPPHR